MFKNTRNINEFPLLVPCLQLFSQARIRHTFVKLEKLKLTVDLLSPLNRYNGSLPNGDRGRRKSRFALYKRTKANGVKPSTVHILNTPQASKVQNK